MATLFPRLGIGQRSSIRQREYSGRSEVRGKPHRDYRLQHAVCEPAGMLVSQETARPDAPLLARVKGRKGLTFRRDNLLNAARDAGRHIYTKVADGGESEGAQDWLRELCAREESRSPYQREKKG